MAELSCELIRQLTAPSLSVTVYREVTSTNTLLREQAENGAAEGTVMIAEAQTAGRGRQGHSFWSPDGTGLYMSVLLRPEQPMAEVVSLLTPMAAVAVARAIEQVSDRTANVQWVNDIYCDGRKVCGILTEGRPDTATGKLCYAIVGVGINVLPPEGGFPEDIRARAGAVLTQPKKEARERLAAAFLNEFMALYARLSERTFFAEYRERCLRLGREVTVLRRGESLPAEVLDVTEAFALRVRFADGSEEELTSGEVSIRPLSVK